MYKTYLSLGVFVVVLSLAWAVIQSPRLARSPCDTPVTYTIGRIDHNFRLNPQTAAAAVNQAAQLWNTAEGRDLLVSTSAAQLIVNFVYDNRSALNSQIVQQENQLNKNTSTLQQQIAQYEADEKVFQQQMNDLNQQIDSYNRQGGAPPDIYRQLIDRQNQLIAQGNALNLRAGQLNLAAQNYNSQIQNLNQNVDQFNAALSQKPEAGLYDPLRHTITIYFVANRPELIHTLAHEFGHALSLPHASDSAAIMYTFTSQSVALSPADRQELNYACRPQPLVFFWYRNLLNFLYNLQNN